MSALSDDAESTRRETLHELGLGEDELRKSHGPGSLGCHEALHTAALLLRAVDGELLEHPAILATPEWFALAHRAHAALFDLYQAIGAGHSQEK